jgi:ABC-2 type transport system permease protein
LLASRLPDQAILFGKLLTSILFGWGMTLFFLLVSLVVVNILEWEGGFQIYQPTILWINLSASLLMSGMVASLGILISLRSATVQSAAQAIMLMLFMTVMLLQAVAFLLPTFLPIEAVRAFLDRLDFTAILLIFLIVLLVATIGLFLAALARFQRSRLV